MFLFAFPKRSSNVFPVRLLLSGTVHVTFAKSVGCACLFALLNNISIFDTCILYNYNYRIPKNTLVIPFIGGFSYDS